MSRYEKILLDKMVDFERVRLEAVDNNDIGQYANDIREMTNSILLLLDCVIEMRELDGMLEKVDEVLK